MEMLTPDEFFERIGVRVPDSVIRRLEAGGCTGTSAQWCPVHGSCTCDRETRHLADFGCPLHGGHSTHGHADIAEGREP